MKYIYINNHSQTPIYQQLYDQISSQIIKRELLPDEALPSLRTLTKDLSISMITIKKTWEMLERNGFIYTVKGRGSYVMENSKANLEDKKIAKVKEVLSFALDSIKDYNLTKDEIIAIINKIEL
jgi:GntR family transcriptional regulator